MSTFRHSIVRQGLISLAMIAVIGCGSDKDPFSPGEELGPYLGAAGCKDCHQSIHSDFVTSGHAQHIQRIQEGAAPDYAWSEAIEHPLPGPPNGLAWDEILLVLGGVTAQTIFLDLEGNQITGPGARWDSATGTWAEYHAGKTVPFDCGDCHMTGYDSEGEHEGPEGLVGTWEEDGVTCEACHGPGRAHAISESTEDITINRTNEFCVGCHRVYRDHPYPGTGVVGRDLEHFGVDCITCHDPHASARFDPARGIRLTCPDCHTSTAPAVHSLHEH